MSDFTLIRDTHGQLVLTEDDGTVHNGVLPVRAFPLSQPDEGIALMSVDGHELVWLPTLSGLAEPLRVLIAEELARREFMPAIRAIRAVSSFSTPCEWEVDTDRGPTRFTLRSEDDIRRLQGRRLLVADSHGIHYEVADLRLLDRPSRRILDRFL